MLGSGGVKAVKPSFVSYVTPEEMKTTEREFSKREKEPDLLPGEVEFCRASPILKCTQDDVSQRGVFGTLLCTNFRLAFFSDEETTEEEAQLFRNRLYGENDIPLTCVDNIYGGFDEKKKLIICSSVRNKYPNKIIIHCKDLRVFQFSLAFMKEEEAKKIFQGIVHHCVETKSFKCLFAFSYAGGTSLNSDNRRRGSTVMFDTLEDWAQEMKRTRGNLRLVTDNADFTLSEKLPPYFIVPLSVSKEDITKFQGKGVPIWCWSHYSGCALFKAAPLPLTQEDSYPQSYMEKMLNAVAQNHLYSVKTEELSETLPTVQDIQQSYSKFKQFFLIDTTNDFWMSDVKWFSSLESTGWLDIIRLCLTKAVEVVESLERDSTNVLITEEEGPDLCCVISTLVQLMLDPYYRTISGFQSLVQKEWVAGGHRFLDRCNHLYQKDKEVTLQRPSETKCVFRFPESPFCVVQVQSPVFLLLLECVWQLLQQHGPAFQFSETYLTVLSDSLNVSVFGTFLFNSPHHRDTVLKAMSPSSQRDLLNCPSVWDWSVQFDSKAQDLFTNPLYSEKPRHDRVPRKTFRPKHQRHFSLPSSAFKSPPKKGFFKEETEGLRKLMWVKRIGRWMNLPDTPQASTRHFYQCWQRRPLDYHGLLLPCVDGPAVRMWTQRYLRWIQEVQIFGGGSITLVRKLAELLGEVEELRRELDWQACRAERGHQRSTARTRSAVRLSSAFPFTTPRCGSFRPAIPTSLLQSLMITGSLVDKDDEDSELLGII